MSYMLVSSIDSAASSGILRTEIADALTDNSIRFTTRSLASDIAKTLATIGDREAVAMLTMRLRGSSSLSECVSFMKASINHKLDISETETARWSACWIKDASNGGRNDAHWPRGLAVLTWKW
jgi:hypothetical protein